MPDVLLLDAGGVLMLPAHDVVLAALASAEVEVDADLLDTAHYAGIRAHDAPASGRSIYRSYLDAYVERLEIARERREPAVRALARAYGDSYRLWMRPVETSVRALRRLAEAGVRIGVVSNADGTVEERLRALDICQVGAGPGARVEVVIDSSVVGVEKPDPAIFTPALQAMDLSAERCLYVGDSVRNDVEGALAAGLRPVLLDPDGLHDSRGHPSVRELGEVSGLL